MLRNHNTFVKGYLASLRGKRKGDKPVETEIIRDKIVRSSIGIVTANEKKYMIISSILRTFGIRKVVPVKLSTDSFDLTDIPALMKAIAGSKISECEFFLARGRLGIPGTGALTVLIHRDGSIVSAVTSPPSHIHRLSLEEAVVFDVVSLFRRIGLKQTSKGITEETTTVYSSLTFIDIIKLITEKKAQPLLAFSGEKVLIIGGYLWGAFLVPFLKKRFKEVCIFDTNSHVINFCSYISDFNKPSDRRFDLIVDLTGFGGIEVNNSKAGNFEGNFIVCEEPSGKSHLKVKKAPHYFLKLKNDIFKTSGTMTISVKISRIAAERVENELPVLYAVPQLLFFESFLFNYASPSGFLNILNNPVIAASSLVNKSISKQIDSILIEEVEKLEFALERVRKDS
jgi:hypothetical protein